MTRLRLCMITTFYPPYNFGGDGRTVQRLSRALVRRGHHVTVIHDADAFDLLNRGAPPVPAPPDGVDVVTLRSGLGAVSPLLTQQLGRPVANGRRIRRVLREGRFDVINYHNVSLVGGPGVLALGDATKVYMAHEHWLVCPTHVLWRHRREVCTDRQCLRCLLHHRRPPQVWRYTGLLDRRLKHVDAFIALSEFSRRQHAAFGFRRAMEVLPSFVPDEPAGTAPAPVRERPYVLFVGRLERIKGLDDIIPAFHGYDGADLVIVGEGEHEAHLRGLAAGNPRIHFLRTLEGEHLAACYAHARAVIVPSVCFETFGIVIIEAFRAGTPVLARRIGPFPELIEASGAGQLFDRAGELIEHLHQMDRDPALRRRLGQAGRDRFAERWSEAAVIPRYLDIVRRAAERRGDQQAARRLAQAVEAA